MTITRTRTPGLEPGALLRICHQAGFGPAIYGHPDVPGTAFVTASAVSGDCEHMELAGCELWPESGALIERVVIAMATGDGKINRIATEIARRVGKWRCARVFWPADDEGMQLESAMQVSVWRGPFALRNCLFEPTPWPVDGIITAEDIGADLEARFRDGVQRGVSPGWWSLWQHWSLMPGRLTVVTGIPGMGKSELIEAALCNLAQEEGWKSAIFSPEHYPIALHALRLAEKLTGHTASKAVYSGVPPMTPGILAEAREQIARSFFWIAPPHGRNTLDAVLEAAEGLVHREGVNVLLIDPWNEIEYQRGRQQSESEFLAATLSRLKDWCRRFDVHLIVIAHPKVMERVKGGYRCPSIYDISGGAQWANKADFCLAVHRDKRAEDGKTEIHVQKVKWREEGKLGTVPLYFVPGCSRFMEHPWEGSVAG